jgi:peptide-methionine (R)-S-oxide reductase
MKKELGEETILRAHEKERPHTGTYNLHYEEGTYYVALAQNHYLKVTQSLMHTVAGRHLMNSIPEKVKYVLDKTHGMIRTEIVCANCNLGHLFNDDQQVLDSTCKFGRNRLQNEWKSDTQMIGNKNRTYSNKV